MMVQGKVMVQQGKLVVKQKGHGCKRKEADASTRETETEGESQEQMHLIEFGAVAAHAQIHSNTEIKLCHHD